MKITAILSAGLVAIGLVCAIGFMLIGSTVDENGLLREPFGLVPLSYLFLATGFLAGISAFWQSCRYRSGSYSKKG